VLAFNDAERAAAGPDRPLRILEIAPVWVPVPPEAYGGIEWVVHWLVEGLRGRGNEVTLLTVGSSTTAPPTEVTFPEPPARIETDVPAEAIHALAIENAVERLRPDLVHDHTLLGPLVRTGVPHIVTAHGPMRGIFGEYYRAISRRTPLVAISDAQRRALPDADWLTTVHNAVDVDAFEMRDDKDDFFLFLGRICRDKGTHLAAEAARAAGRRLVIAGRIAEPRERRYFRRKVDPLLGDGVEYVGEADFDTKRDLLGRARALLCPAQWDEPFGMVLIEALASGTPVITFNRGAAREIVDDGETGAIVGSVEEMAEVMRTLDADPKRCRAVVEERFDVPLMVERYETVMRRVVEGNPRTALSAL
jgi:glycosyltransferase involved in cell wall biosynthesis